MNSITQEMRFRQSLMKYSEKYGAKIASRKYNKCRSYIYFRKSRWDGTVESLAEQSKCPYQHPNNPTPSTQPHQKYAAQSNARSLNNLVM